uniref:Phosphorylase b kinase regulatory subunit n=1 Tax=Eptatretus burgeri TaxID=7764 RepID=A0A8C4QQZ7_EPTBU
MADNETQKLERKDPWIYLTFPSHPLPFLPVKCTMLDFQSPTIGLFPTETHKEPAIAKVRDNAYCAAALWALSLAYRRIDDDKGRKHELESCAVKCMRGILYCYMRQSHKLQKFKEDPSAIHCPHSAFHLQTGDQILDYKDYGHLQIDAMSLFLLYLVEMISSGLQIIYSTDEVAFVQNLVFCVERAYRVPDFGMWERGNKYNNGSTELHASSLGLAKAALEAISGFNLFGNQGCSWSVIFVDTDAHNRNRQTFTSLLPRESRSHNTDAALLPCCGYPAFAVDDETLRSQTLGKVVRKLRRRFGFKRFLRDGYRTPLEDSSRRHYKPAEIKLFDGIECEFPLFHLYMMCVCVSPWMYPCTCVLPGHIVVPEYYRVPYDLVEGEKHSPGSQTRCASTTNHPGMLFLWGQALYVIAQLLVEELISPEDIDPICRYIPPKSRRNVSMRYSNQVRTLATNTLVNVTLVAENERLQAFLNTYGIQSQTPLLMEPVYVWPQSELVKVYTNLARNDKLGLKGRPPRPVGCLGTSKIYRILSHTVVCLPVIFDLSDFYMSQDVFLLIDDIKNCLQYVAENWRLQGRPLFLILIREDNLRGERFAPMMDMLTDFKKGIVGKVKVRVDRIQVSILIGEFTCHSFVELEKSSRKKLKRMSSTPGPSQAEAEEVLTSSDMAELSTHDILIKLTVTVNRQYLEPVLYNPYRSLLRQTTGLLGKAVDNLAPSITNIVVHGKQLTLGVFGGGTEVTIANPVSPAVARQLVYSVCPSHDPRAPALLQELVIHVGWIITNSPAICDGILQFRIGWIIHAMSHLLKLRVSSKDHSTDQDLNLEPQGDLNELAPSAVKHLLLDVLQLHQEQRCWKDKRHLDGALNRTPRGFYDRVWQILERTPKGMIVCGRYLPQQPTLSDMMMYEMNFSLLVEKMLQHIQVPEYRQIIVELLMVVSIMLQRNPEVHFQEKMDLDHLVREAVREFHHDQGEMFHEFYNTPPVGEQGTANYMTKVVVSSLLSGTIHSSAEDPCIIS